MNSPASTPDQSLAAFHRRRTLFISLALFFIGLGVRCIGLQWGLPAREHWYSYHPDEAQMLAAIASLDVFSGDFNPNFFNYPSLFIYLAYGAHLLAGGLGLARPFSNDPAQTWMFAHDVLFYARVVTALLGAATVVPVFLIARRLAENERGGEMWGVFAALLLALAPGHVQHSHFATVDVPATFFVTLCLWLSTRALTTNPERQRRAILLAAFAAGLAAATKYNAGLIVIAPLAAWFFLYRQKHTSLSALPKLLVVAIIAFLVGCPYSVLDFSNFWGDGKNAGVAYELFVHPRQGHGEVFLQTGNGWLYHATFNAPFLLTAPILIAALIGIARALRIQIPVQRSVWAMLLIWCAFYFFALGFSEVRFMRYLLPMAPALCVFAASGVLALRGVHRLLPRVAGVLLLLCSAWGARDVLHLFAAVDPRDQAAQFMAQNTQSTPARVGMIGLPWYYSPPLSPLDSPPFRRLSVEQLSALSGNKYRFVVTGLDAQKLANEKPQWFVISELEWREKARLQDAQWQTFLTALEREYSLTKQFQNQPPLALPGRAFVPHDFLYPNPEIRIYRRR